MTNNDTVRATRATFDEVTDATTRAYDALASGHTTSAYAQMLIARDALNASIAALAPMMEWNN